MDKIAQIIGLVSAALTTSSFVPQAIKTWRTRSTGDLSPLMFSLFFVGIAGWLVYGFLTRDLPITVANIVTICLAGIILFFILIGKKSKSIAHIGLYVKDLEKMQEFYCSFFQARAGTLYSNPKKKFTSCFLTFPVGTSIELMHLQDHEIMSNSGWGHIAISVGSESNVNSVSKLLKESGIEQMENPRHTGDGYYESLFRDPEGNYIEITV
jgi:lactoylglutathione lyase